MELQLVDVLRMIQFANDRELSQIVQTVLTRYHTLYPSEEVVFLSLPSPDSQERHAAVRHAINQLLRQ